MRCRGYAISHIGNSRDNHEDNYLLGKTYLLPEQVEMMSHNRKMIIDQADLADTFCVAISDGMGGYEAGEVASLLTVQYLLSHKISKYDEINQCILDLNRHVAAEAKKECGSQNMGATLCGVVSTETKTYCFNVGDSRLYRYSDGLLKQVTTDNTEGQRLLDLGLLTEEEVRSFPKRKAIYKYIGKDIDLIPDIYEIDAIDKGSFLLLCSDGLSDVLNIEEIQDMLSKKFISTQDKGILLVKMAAERKPDAGDNITVIILEY